MLCTLNSRTFFCSTEVWARGLLLAKQGLYHSSPTPRLLLSVCFPSSVWKCFCPSCSWTTISHLCSWVTGITDVHYHACADFWIGNTFVWFKIQKLLEIYFVWSLSQSVQCALGPWNDLQFPYANIAAPPYLRGTCSRTSPSSSLPAPTTTTTTTATNTKIWRCSGPFYTML
jgi:hypothetical protein